MKDIFLPTLSRCVPNSVANKTDNVNNWIQVPRKWVSSYLHYTSFHQLYCFLKGGEKEREQRRERK